MKDDAFNSTSQHNKPFDVTIIRFNPPTHHSK
jgi:hypothetical protein